MATIYTFSSTGNSLYVAKEIAREAGGEVVFMRNQTAVCEDDLVGFVFPVYYWRLPRIVERFVEKIEISHRDAYVFGIATHGGDEYGALNQFARILKLKGINLNYGAKVRAIGNYLPNYAIKNTEEAAASFEARTQKVVEAIKCRQENRSSALTILARLGGLAFPGEESDRFFSVSGACTACMTCQRMCPVDNIAIENKRPVFGHRCEHCLGCLHMCPASALNWKTKTQGKERYRNRNVSAEELIS
ncbi:MAG: EFR1 family ferrodoxin [Coriobacteriia bacterium]|nr:EFR1 family ferrodoxin [Coriobacteriia bacterium]MCL2750993.1 EFR1 family ferrodoxin [Coriobacteriia bacterium]